MPGYIGFGYTNFSFPIEINTIITLSDLAHEKYGTPFLDTEYKGTYYAFLFGFDTFASSILYYDAMPEAEMGAGLGIFFTAEDRFGFGTSQVSPEAVTAAEALNPGFKAMSDTFTAIYFENVSSIGLRWRGQYGKARVAVGFGYEFAITFVSAFASPVDKPGKLGFQINESLFHQGPIARAYVQW